MTDAEKTLAHYRVIELSRELTEREERRVVALLKCIAEDREAEQAGNEEE